jgi:acetoacetate decarboxylase
MKESEVRERAFAMPLTSPAFPRGPYRFCQREYLIIEYRTDLNKLQAVVLGPLEVYEPIVKYEFIRMPDSTGFGDYTESGQVSPGIVSRPQGQLFALYVLERRSADRRRARALGIPEETGAAEPARRRA